MKMRTVVGWLTGVTAFIVLDEIASVILKHLGVPFRIDLDPGIVTRGSGRMSYEEIDDGGLTAAGEAFFSLAIVLAIWAGRCVAEPDPALRFSKQTAAFGGAAIIFLLLYGVAGVVLFKLFSLREGYVAVVGNALQLAAIGGAFLAARWSYTARMART